MDPEIDAGLAAINAAAEGGRGQGLDWASSLTFDTGKEVSASLIDNIVIVLPRANLIIASCTVLQVDEYLREMKFSKHRMNHNFGVRVTYLRCSVSACPYRSRLLENLDYNEDIPHFEIEVLTATEHNHQVETKEDSQHCRKILFGSILKEGRRRQKRYSISPCSSDMIPEKIRHL